MIRLADIYLSDELSEELIAKTKEYNGNHPDDVITVQKSAELFLEYGIKYLDISAFTQ